MKKILIIAAVTAATLVFTGCEKKEEQPGAATLSALKSDADKAAKKADKAATAAQKEAAKQADAAKKAAEKATK